MHAMPKAIAGRRSMGQFAWAQTIPEGCSQVNSVGSWGTSVQE